MNSAWMPGVSPLPKARKISAKPPANAQNATMSTSTSAVVPGQTRAITPASAAPQQHQRALSAAGDAAGPQKPGYRLGILQTRTRSSRADRSGVGDVRGSSRRVAAAAGPEKGLKAIVQTRQRTLKMNETCDRCGPAIRAVYRVTRNGELYLCGHCAKRLWPALSAQGWASTVTLRAAGRTRAGHWPAPWAAIRAAWGWFARAEGEGRARTRTPD